MQLSRYDILSYSLLSFEFNFRCNKKEITHFDEYNVFGGNWQKTLKTDFMSYMQAKTTLAKICMLIKSHAHTQWDDLLKVNIKFPTDILNTYHINSLKLVLSFDDTYLYKMFPDRKNRIGSRPISELLKSGSTQDSLRHSLCSNIYGIDLSNVADNIISYRYIGGKDYQDKYQEISAIIDKWIIDTYSVVNNPEYTQEEISRLSSLSKNDSNFDDIFVSFDSFKKYYKNVHIMVDLYDIDGQENVFWSSINDRLKQVFKTLKPNKNIKMMINYDTDAGRIQIKDTTLYGVSGLHDIDLVDCIVSGDISNISLYFTHVTNTNADYCEFFNGCDIMKSKLNSCYIADDVKTIDTCITGDSTVSGNCSNCELSIGVKYTKDAKIKDSKNNATKI